MERRFWAHIQQLKRKSRRELEEDLVEGDPLIPALTWRSEWAQGCMLEYDALTCIEQEQAWWEEVHGAWYNEW